MVRVDLEMGDGTRVWGGRKRRGWNGQEQVSPEKAQRNERGKVLPFLSLVGGGLDGKRKQRGRG